MGRIVTSVDRRTLLASLAGGPLIPAFKTVAWPVLRPEDFGARGDGVTNDSAALSKMCSVIVVNRGGTVVLAPGKIYVVGKQRPAAGLAFEPQNLLEFQGLANSLTIVGNGACLRAAPGLRFGAFDRESGRPSRRGLPNFDQTMVAAPYRGMIVVRGCRGPIVIRDLELDGNVAKLFIGDRWGDQGWQVPGSGLILEDNFEREVVENICSHDHPLDGAIIDGTAHRTHRSRISRMICHNNGRQAVSIVGGSNYDFEDCEFSSTGRSVVQSPPGAGVDLEAEGGKVIRDCTFIRCKFVDNVGAGLLADTGDTADVRFLDCLFVGTTSWSAWPSKPDFAFERCTFAGTVVHGFASRDPNQAVKFRSCRFTDNPTLSPTSRLFISGEAGNGVVNLEPSDNVLFSNCSLDLRHGGVLPWSWRATYQDCSMRQVSGTPAMTKGRYLGTTQIDGPVDLYGSMIEGTVILNGKRVPIGPVGNDFLPW